MDMLLPLSRPSAAALITFTWVTVLLVSDLPNAIWQAIDGEPPAWLLGVKILFLLTLILVSRTWSTIRATRPFLILLLVLLLALWSMSWLRETPAYRQWEGRSGWIVAMAAFQLLKLAVALVMIGVLRLMGRQREFFFLTPGQLNTPVRSMEAGKKPAGLSLSWGRLGLILGVCILPLTLLFFGMGNLPASGTLVKALPFLPLALLFAATNAFSEEMQFRASLLGDLRNAVGDDHAIWITALFFGFAHYFGGAPSGIPGVLIAGLLGALFANCMLRSKGMVVPWFIHFCQNAVIYAFWAFGFVS